MKHSKEIISTGTAARGTQRKAAEKSVCASTEDRQCMIAEAAYYRAHARGFAPGYELEDWLQAEAEVNRKIECD